MRKSRFTAAQIFAIVRECDAGASVGELVREHGVHANTIRLWKSKHDGMDVADVVRLKSSRPRTPRCTESSLSSQLKVDAMDNLIRKNGWGTRSDKKR